MGRSEVGRVGAIGSTATGDQLCWVLAANDWDGVHEEVLLVVLMTMAMMMMR